MSPFWKKQFEEWNFKALIVMIVVVVIAYHLIGLWIIPIYFFIALIKNIG